MGGRLGCEYIIPGDKPHGVDPSVHLLPSLASTPIESKQRNDSQVCAPVHNNMYYVFIMTPYDSHAETFSQLKALSKIIQEAIDSIESTVLSKHLKFPSPYTPVSLESEKVRALPEVEKACSLAISAATQLVFSLRSPMASVVTTGIQVKPLALY